MQCKRHYVVRFLLSNSPASKIYMPTFRNTLSVCSLNCLSKQNGQGSNGLTTFSGNCGFIHGGFWEEINRASDTQTYVLYQICDDTFIWPHGQEILTEFLNHLNGFHNKKHFTTEEEESHLPLMDIDIYRKTKSSLGHKVYRKPTITISTYTRIASPSC